MRFKQRSEAGRLLAQALKNYKDKNVVVYALPRGGVITAVEIARFLHAPLDLIIIRKVGHPQQPEYAIAAVAEDGHLLGSERELATVNQRWLKQEIAKQRKEARRRREAYLSNKPEIPATGKIAILVDDGVATGLTMRVAILELKHRHPEKIIVAVPVAPLSTANLLKAEAGEIVALEIPADKNYLGAVGAYYEDFSQVEDAEVITALKCYEAELSAAHNTFSQTTLSAALAPILFVFPYYHSMAEKLVQIFRMNLGKFTAEHFANGELTICIDNTVQSKVCIVLGATIPPEINLVTFLLLCHTLKKEQAGKIIALLPYLAYSRQDKNEPQKSYAAEFMRQLFEASGINELVTVDVHNEWIERLFSIPLVSLSPAKIFAQAILEQSLQDATIVAPDKGAIKRCETVIKELGIKSAVTYVNKTRTATGVTHGEIHGNVGSRAVIIDDILDTGETLLSCCQKLIEQGTAEIYIMVTHGLFTGEKWQRLWDLKVKHIYCTDTIPLPAQIISEKISTLATTALIASYFKEKVKC